MGVNLPTTATQFLLKKVITLSVCMENSEGIIGGLQKIFLSKHTMDQSNKGAASTDRYDTIVLGGPSPSIASMEILKSPYWVYLKDTFLEAWVQLTCTKLLAGT